jgi:VanZ family protein
MEVSLAGSIATRPEFKSLIFWGPLLFATYMAFTPIPHAITPSMSDKTLHLLAFAYLSAALWWAYPRWGSSYFATAMLVAYGVCIEAVQALIPNRSASLFDLVADCIGIGIGLGVVHLARWIQARFASTAYRE